MSDITRALQVIDRGEPQAAERLLPLVYDELRKLAAAKMAHEKPGQTLQATALVHEAWLRLGGDPKRHWAGRTHFFSAAAEAMRRILIDRAREKLSQKRGGDRQRTELTDSRIVLSLPADELLAVHEALERLAQQDPQSAELVKLRYFVGMTMTEAAEALEMPIRSAERRWTFAKAWLRREIGARPED